MKNETNNRGKIHTQYQMYLPALFPYDVFRKKIIPFIGPNLYFLYIQESDRKTWTFESLYLSLEDAQEDRLIYEKSNIAVKIRTKPSAGGKFEVEEVNEYLEGAKWRVRRFVAQECEPPKGGFELMAEMEWK